MNGVSLNTVPFKSLLFVCQTLFFTATKEDANIVNHVKL
jgi:hypothetical protein